MRVRMCVCVYLVFQELLPHQKYLLQLVPALLGPAAHGRPALPKGLTTETQQVRATGRAWAL